MNGTKSVNDSPIINYRHVRALTDIINTPRRCSAKKVNTTENIATHIRSEHRILVKEWVLYEYSSSGIHVHILDGEYNLLFNRLMNTEMRNEEVAYCNSKQVEKIKKSNTQATLDLQLLTASSGQRSAYGANTVIKIGTQTPSKIHAKIIQQFCDQSTEYFAALKQKDITETRIILHSAQEIMNMCAKYGAVGVMRFIELGNLRTTHCGDRGNINLTRTYLDRGFDKNNPLCIAYQ